MEGEEGGGDVAEVDPVSDDLILGAVSVVSGLSTTNQVCVTTEANRTRGVYMGRSMSGSWAGL